MKVAEKYFVLIFIDIKMGRTLGYWDVRGLGMPIRLMLAYLDVDYEDKLYSLTKAPHDKGEWLAVKHSLGFDFPNLPYWEDGDIKLTESRAILRHIARVHDSTSTLLPTDAAIACKADMIENIVFEPMFGLARFAFDFDPSKKMKCTKSFTRNYKISLNSWPITNGLQERKLHS